MTAKTVPQFAGFLFQQEVGMDRPDVAAIDRLEFLTQEIQEMKDVIRDMEQEIDGIPGVVAEQTQDKDERIEAARYLYWNYSSIPVREIKNQLLGGSRALHLEIAKASVNIDCERCGSSLSVKSRTDFEELRKEVSGRKRWVRRLLCEGCKKLDREESNRDWQIRQENERRRIIELAQMPYREYLLTPEWQDRRKSMLKSARYSCQVCNASGVTLDVHHRTYERRGNEYNRDLIVLCRSCHGTFHGKLEQS